ncbi:hypothetical protein ACFWE5_03845 [Cellulosimicrobium funkei]|uniref:hypothetical protein n=1 Tax=Cellulosimicrobium funkei TaxID=264251 RepID=UPI00365C334F
MTTTSTVPRPVASAAALRQSLGEARIAQRVATNRVARLEQRLGLTDQSAEQLVETYADLYGDTPEVTARRRAILRQDSIAMDGRVKLWRAARARRQGVPA